MAPPIAQVTHTLPPAAAIQGLSKKPLRPSPPETARGADQVAPASVDLDTYVIQGLLEPTSIQVRYSGRCPPPGGERSNASTGSDVSTLLGLMFLNTFTLRVNIPAASSKVTTVMPSPSRPGSCAIWLIATCPIPSETQFPSAS